MFLLQQGPLMLTTSSNKIRNRIKTIFLSILLLVCANTKISARKDCTDFSQENKNIKLTVHQLSLAQMRKLFNCYNPVKIVRLTSHYQALEITIENRTPQEYVLDQNNIGLKLESNLIVKRKIKTNPVLIPILTTIASSAILVAGIGFAVIPSIIAGTALGVTTLNLNMHQSNKISTKSIRNKVLDTQHPTLIENFSKTKKIIFVASKNMKLNFPIIIESLHDKQKITFDISLKK